MGKIFLILSFISSDLIKIFLCRSIEKLILSNETSQVWLSCLLNFYRLSLCSDMDSCTFFVLSMNVWCTCLWTVEQFHPCQLTYFVIVFLPDFCSLQCLDRFLNCTLYQVKSFEAMWKWFSYLLPQDLPVQGNFAINVTVRRERSRVMKSDAVGVDVTSLSFPSFTLTWKTVAALYRAWHSLLFH